MEIDKKDLDSILAEEKRRKLEESYIIKAFYLELFVNYNGALSHSLGRDHRLRDGVNNEWVKNKLIISFRKKYEELIREKYIDKILLSLSRLTERKKWISMRDDSFINIEDFSVEFCFLDDEYFTLPEPPSKYEKFNQLISKKFCSSRIIKT